MRVLVLLVFLGVGMIGGVMGEEKVAEVRYGSELRLTPEMRSRPVAKKLADRWRRQFYEGCWATIDLVRDPAGRVEVDLVLRLGADESVELRGEEVETLMRWLDGVLRKGVGGGVVSTRVGEEAVSLAKVGEDRLLMMIGGWQTRVPEGDLHWLVRYLGGGVQRYKVFERQWGFLEEGKDVSFWDVELRTWRLIHHLGQVELKELGKYWVTLEALGRKAGGFEWVRTSWTLFERGERNLLTTGLLSALADVPAHFDRGEVFRWETKDALLRAFPENKAIFYRPDVRREKDIRVDVAAALEARRVVDQRDRLQVWVEGEAQPALRKLVGRGDPEFFEIWK